MNLALCIVLPLIIGPYLGLDQEGLRQLTQRTLFFTGFATILQAYWGHKMPIYEGLSTIWISAIIILNGNALLTAKPLSQLQSELALGFIAGGLLYIIIASMKLMGPISKLFTPVVMGNFFVLIVLQIIKSIASNFICLTNGIFVINELNMIMALITITTIYFVNKFGCAYISNFSLLIGAITGWIGYIVASLYGLTIYRFVPTDGLPILEFPEPFSWGIPRFDLVVISTSLIIAFMVFANLIATVKGMANLLKVDNLEIDRAVLITGVANIIGGLWGVIGFVPMSHCIGFVEVTGNSSKKPLILHAVFLMIMGLIPSLGAFFTSMPSVVGQAILLVVLLKMFRLGMYQYSLVASNLKNKITIYIPLTLGVVLLLMPQNYFSGLPVIVAGMAGNGFVMGLLVTLLLDNLL